MVWLLATLHDGTTIEYGIPMDEPIHALLQDAARFSSVEVLSVDYNYV